MGDGALTDPLATSVGTAQDALRIRFVADRACAEASVARAVRTLQLAHAALGGAAALVTGAFVEVERGPWLLALPVAVVALAGLGWRAGAVLARPLREHARARFEGRAVALAFDGEGVAYRIEARGAGDAGLTGEDAEDLSTGTPTGVDAVGSVDAICGATAWCDLREVARSRGHLLLVHPALTLAVPLPSLGPGGLERVEALANAGNLGRDA